MLRLVLFAIAISAGYIADQSTAKDISAAQDDISNTQIEKLVAQLASPNKAPKIVVPDDAIYDPKFDHEAQQKVYAAWSKLRDLAPRSFPFLFKHVSDNRYALTEDAGDFEKNYSVGFLCRDILVSHLQPDVWDHKDPGTAFRRRPYQPDYVEHFRLLKPSAAREWWRTRKDRSLRELQIEVLEWVLKEETGRPDKYTQEDRDSVKKELAELKASRKPREPSLPFPK